MIYSKYNDNDGVISLKLINGYTLNKDKVLKTKIITDGTISTCRSITESLNIYYNNEENKWITDSIQKSRDKLLDETIESIFTYTEESVKIYNANYIIRVLYVYISEDKRWEKFGQDVLIGEYTDIIDELRLLNNMQSIKSSYHDEPNELRIDVGSMMIRKKKRIKHNFI